jgi:hypothetical protein
VKIFLILAFVNTLPHTHTGSPYVTQAGLDLKILLPPPLEYWDYKHAPPSSIKLSNEKEFDFSGRTEESRSEVNCNRLKEENG